jgi:hypothetical protein
MPLVSIAVESGLCLLLESAAQRLGPTLNGRVRIKTLFRLLWQHKTEAAGWQEG